MIKLKFKVRGTEVECSGDADEIDRIITKLICGNYGPVTAEIRAEPRVVQGEKKSIQEKLPAQEELINYVTSKPSYEHNIFEIQEHFFGLRFGSRGPEEKKYNALYRRLARAREKIEKEHGGKFSSEWAYTPQGEIYKVFKFIKSEGKQRGTPQKLEFNVTPKS